MPLESQDSDRAAEICAEVSRAVLRDFAPGLVFLDLATRRRLQALMAYTVTLYDFARQTGVEGERLAAINRWEFTLETALDGNPPGQPVFVAMAAAEREAPWPRDALDALAQEARTRAVEPRAATIDAHRLRSERLASALYEALVGEAPEGAARPILGALVRLHGLLALHDGLRRRTPALAREELVDHWWDETDSAAVVRRAARAAADRIETELEVKRDAVGSLARPARRAVVYAALAGRDLLAASRRLDPTKDPDFPALGAARRIKLLARARLARV